MHEEILDEKTRRLLDEIEKIKELDNFYLAGGTALALEIGHRKSIDLDWFSEKPFSTEEVKNKLKSLGKLKIDEELEDTLNCNLNGVKLSFFEYPYKNLFPFEKYNKIRLADLRDIACMKINAISSRGSKKDFIDLYFILQKILLDNLLKLFDKKYKDIEYNHLHILKSLTYFDEAEKQPSPIMLEKVSWSDIKQEIDKKVKKCLK